MKRIFLVTAICFIMICSSFALAGCDEFKPYIEVKGLKTEYNVGEELYIGSAKIFYYEDSEFYSEIDLKSNMITGFSTTTAGKYEMTITYNNISTKIEYVVIDSNDQSGVGQPLTEEEVNILLIQVVDTMTSYAEIKENSTTSFWGYEFSSYQITTQNKRYIYDDEENYNWIIKEDNNWYYYEVEYDAWDEEVKYSKYSTEINGNDLRKHTYSNINEDSTFVQATKNGNNYTIKYNSNIMINCQTQINIADNKINSILFYDISGEEPELITTTYFTYYNNLTSEIPSVPNEPWEYKGKVWI